MLRIATLEIAGFRGIKEGQVAFTGHDVLIAPNNGGKTTVIDALALLLGRDRLIRDLTEHDFYGSTPLPDQRIKIIGTVCGFSPNDPNDHTEWFRHGRGVPKWLNPGVFV